MKWPGVALCLLASLGSISAQCTDSYESYPNMHVSGGTRVSPDPVDRAACQTACEQDMNCVGYDWTGSQCYLITNPDTGITGDPGATHYRKIQTCVVGGNSCIYRYVGAFTVAAANMIGSTIASPCGDDCNSNGACMAYIEDTANTNCNLASTFALANRVANANKRMYSQFSCTSPLTVCADKAFTAQADMHVSGGTRATSGDTSVNTCEGVCAADNACIGFDYTDGGSCYVISNPDTPVTEDLTATHYRGSRTCTTGSNACGYDLFGAFVPNTGTTTTNSQTYDQCVTRCNDDTACTQLAYDAASDTCITSTGAATEKTANADYEMLRKQTTCPDAGSTTDPSGCGAPDWMVIEGRSSGGGTFTSGGDTGAACRQLCLDNANCVAVDFEQGAAQPCWLHTNMANLNDERNSPGVQQHRLVDRCPGVCTPTFATNSGQSSSGGNRVAGTFTAMQCQQHCIDTAACVAVDHVVASSQCWMHTDLANLVNPRDTPGINQYVISRSCGGDTTTQFSTTGTGGDTTLFSTTGGGGCNPDWTVVAGRSSPGATNQASSVNTVPACQQACLDLANNACLGFDMDATAQPCWLHTDATMFAMKRSTSGITQHTLNDRCPGACVNEWTVTENTHGLGGTFQQNLNTLAECRQGCIDNANCVALDFNTNQGNFPCWFFFATGYQTDGETGTNHHVLARCTSGGSTTGSSGGSTSPGGCINTWTNTTSRSSGNGVAQSVNGVDACLLACVDNDDCVAADVDSNGGCWHHLDENNLSDERNTPGVTQYRLSRCSGGGGCPAFQEYENMHALNGMPQSATTLDDCKQTCLSNAACEGLDFDAGAAGTKCYTFSMEKAPSMLREMQGTSHFDLLCRAGQTLPGGTTGGSTTGPGCENQWAVTEGRSSGGGQQDTTATDMDSCRDACVANEDCVAVDVVASPFQCWLHLSEANLNDERSSPGVQQHVLTRCVPTGDCPYFEDYENMHGTGGVPRTAATTLDACMADCDSNADCEGLDYEEGGNIKCYIFTTQKAPNDLTDLNGVTHYDLICRTGETRGTTRPGGSTATGVCVDTFTSEDNVHGLGGVEFAAADLDECKDACSDAAEADCVAFDFQASPVGCWLLPAGFTKENLNGITQYTINRCTGACTDTFDEVANTHGLGGMQRAGISGRANCEAECLGDNTCTAIDVAGNQCWFFTTTTYTREGASGVTHLVRVECTNRSTGGTTTRGTTTRPCTVSFNGRNAEIAATNEEAYTGIPTATICIQICARLPVTCYGANFDSINFTCTLVMDESATVSAAVNTITFFQRVCTTA